LNSLVGEVPDKTKVFNNCGKRTSFGTLPGLTQKFGERIDVLEVVGKCGGIRGDKIPKKEEVIDPFFQWAEIVSSINCGDGICQAPENAARTGASEGADVI
jgi:hypothetical protein